MNDEKDVNSHLSFGEHSNELFIQYKGCFRQIRELEMESFGPCLLKQLNAVKLMNQMKAMHDNAQALEQNRDHNPFCSRDEKGGLQTATKLQS